MARRFYCSGLSTGGLLGSEGPRSQRESKTVGWNLPHKMFMFLTSVDKSITNRFLMSSRWKWPKNDIIRTIIKDITWEIFLQSSKPVSLKIVRFQLFSVQLIGRTPGIHWCHFHIDTMKNKQFRFCRIWPVGDRARVRPQRLRSVIWFSRMKIGWKLNRYSKFKLKALRIN